MSLANRYRPQKFAEVVGQKLATTALSRAASEDRVAPAYLLSGTRGVGKTTIARIFAKALNCEHSPVSEPCNECGSCKRITSGTHVDVTEIDAASNTGVDDVRALRENIGFVPMEGRYKIFIIDEAHMLSKSAFNALLKTLEEPPPKTVFIFATTEVHKFPATIISRCQHFVFRHLPEDEISAHLARVLGMEGIAFEEDALHVLARRAQGSARDSLSLLDQVLALEDGKLSAKMVREALGLAGQEFFAELFNSLASVSLPKILELSRRLLHNGADIGFFTRELAENLRNLFLLRQCGDAILSILEVSADEAAFFKKYAALFGTSHLHAAWQMVLDAQRGIAASPEPGAPLELLLLNLAMLPKLLPIANVERLGGGGNGDEGKTSVSPEEKVPEAKKKPDLTNEAGSLKNGLTESATAASQAEASTGSHEDWISFRAFCEANGQANLSRVILGAVNAKWQNGELTIFPDSEALWEQVEKSRPVLLDTLDKYCHGASPKLNIIKPPPPVSKQEIFAACEELPEVRLCKNILDARLLDCQKNSK